MLQNSSHQKYETVSLKLLYLYDIAYYSCNRSNTQYSNSEDEQLNISNYKTFRLSHLGILLSDNPSQEQNTFRFSSLNTINTKVNFPPQAFLKRTAVNTYQWLLLLCSLFVHIHESLVHHLWCIQQMSSINSWKIRWPLLKVRLHPNFTKNFTRLQSFFNFKFQKSKFHVAMFLETDFMLLRWSAVNLFSMTWREDACPEVKHKYSLNNVIMAN